VSHDVLARLLRVDVQIGASDRSLAMLDIR